MKAADVKEGLRGRHPAFADIGLGPWTTLEEFANIDLLAFSAWSSKKPPIVGYEVKVSRSDYRRELLKPGKRAHAVAACWSFYFATPKGLLTKEEKSYVEPEHFEDGSAFVRDKCPARCEKSKRNWYREEKLTPAELEARRRSGKEFEVPVVYGDAACLINFRREEVKGEVHRPDEKQSYLFGGRIWGWEVCTVCEGRGYLRKSVVEQEAPTLWVPRDVGLVEVDEEGRCRTVRKAPIEKPTEPIGDLCSLVRWASFRPDPRHAQDNAPTLQAVAA